VSDPQPVSELIEATRQRLRSGIPADDIGDDLDDEELEGIRQHGIERMREQRWHATMPSRFVHARLEHFTGTVAADLEGWTRAAPRPNLVLFGAVGVGKSHAAAAATYEDHQRGLEVLFLPVVELLDQLRPGGPENALERLWSVDRLVLDDVGSERATDWTGERLYALLNRRWLEERPTIATTNLEPDDLREAIGERTYSRLCGSDAHVVRLAGDDRRFHR
jgi:DNA replication protein DnaC